MTNGIVETAKRYPSKSMGIAISFVAVALILLALFLTLPNVSTAEGMFHATLCLTGVIIATIAIISLLFEIMESETERKDNERSEREKKELITQIELVKEEIRKGEPVQLMSHPDDIWTISIRMLEDLITQTPGHAYDVTTFFNKIRYEEAVSKVLERGIRFHRLFCFPDQSQRTSDKVLQWFFRKIIDGKPFDKTEIVDFETELIKAFKERESDTPKAQLDEEDIKRLRNIINRQHNAYHNNFLSLGRLFHHMHIDFVAIEYSSKGIAECEVMANFKTEITGETYVVGTHARGSLAYGYRDLFNNILFGGGI
jgi:hypothetical protein